MISKERSRGTRCYCLLHNFAISLFHTHTHIHARAHVHTYTRTPTPPHHAYISFIFTFRCIHYRQIVIRRINTVGYKRELFHYNIKQKKNHKHVFYFLLSSQSNFNPPSPLTRHVFLNICHLRRPF